MGMSLTLKSGSLEVGLKCEYLFSVHTEVLNTECSTILLYQTNDHRLIAPKIVSRNKCSIPNADTVRHFIA